MGHVQPNCIAARLDAFSGLLGAWKQAKLCKISPRRIMLALARLEQFCFNLINVTVI
jgi:hypothetical protein